MVEYAVVWRFLAPGPCARLNGNHDCLLCHLPDNTSIPPRLPRPPYRAFRGYSPSLGIPNHHSGHTCYDPSKSRPSYVADSPYYATPLGVEARPRTIFWRI